MKDNEAHIPQTYNELSPAQRWKISRHPQMYAFSVAWGLCFGFMFPWLMAGIVVTLELFESLLSSPLGLAFVILVLIIHVGICIGAAIIGVRMYRSQMAELIRDFLAAEAEIAEQSAITQ